LEVDKYGFTKVGNDKIAHWAVLNTETVGESINELKYYNIIAVNEIPGGSKTKEFRRRKCRGKQGDGSSFDNALVNNRDTSHFLK